MRLLAKTQYNLVLVTRTTAKLEKIEQELSKQYSINITIITQYLSKPAAHDGIYQQLQYQQINIDLLIHNAGLGDVESFTNSKWLRGINIINVTALTHMMKLFLPDMIQRE